jgi:hypothetical protein
MASGGERSGIRAYIFGVSCGSCPVAFLAPEGCRTQSPTTATILPPLSSAMARMAPSPVDPESPGVVGPSAKGSAASCVGWKSVYAGRFRCRWMGWEGEKGGWRTEGGMEMNEVSRETTYLVPKFMLSLAVTFPVPTAFSASVSVTTGFPPTWIAA